jgi:hypothetical protein
MQIHNLNDFTGGWVVGDFDPALIHCRDAEVAVKYYKEGDTEPTHVHKVATEVTVVVMGTVVINGEVIKRGSIAVLKAGESASFTAVTDAITCVIKSPSIKGDKYVV